MLYQEVDPLEQIDHKTIAYEAFQHKFYNPADTKTGRAWRKVNEIVCAPRNFDPVLGFGDYTGFP